MRIREDGKIFRTAAEWEEIIARFESSGQSPSAFCEAEKISGTSLFKWRGKLRGATSQIRRADFVEAKGGSISGAGESYEIRLRGERAIRVKMPFNAAVLSELIRVVEKC